MLIKKHVLSAWQVKNWHLKDVFMLFLLKWWQGCKTCISSKAFCLPSYIQNTKHKSKLFILIFSVHFKFVLKYDLDKGRKFSAFLSQNGPVLLIQLMILWVVFTHQSTSSTCSHQGKLPILIMQAIGCSGDQSHSCGPKRMSQGQRATPKVQFVQRRGSKLDEQEFNIKLNFLMFTHAFYDLKS